MKERRISKSPRSGFVSEKLPRASRLLRRDGEVRPVDSDDFKYLWAAYRSGDFDLPVPEGLEAKDFDAVVLSVMAGFDDWRIVTAPTKRGVIPVGLFGGQVMDDRKNLSSHVLWFPWASERNKLEAMVRYLANMRHDFIILAKASFDFRDFFNHVCRYGVLRRVGTINGWFDGEPCALYQSQGGIDRGRT